MNDYLTVQSNGFITYCDALIARFSGNTGQSLFFSLVGSPAHVQAASAHFFNGGLCLVTDPQGATFTLDRGYGSAHTSRARKIGNTVNKVMISADYFPAATTSATEEINVAVIFGQDIHSVVDRAFLRVNGCTTMPLKREWREWLWEEILQPEKLYSFGNRQLQEAWLISWREETLEELILEGIRQKYLN